MRFVGSTLFDRFMMGGVRIDVDVSMDGYYYTHWVKMVTWVIAWRSMWDRNFDPVCKKDTPSTTGCDLILHISLI